MLRPWAAAVAAIALGACAALEPAGRNAGAPPPPAPASEPAQQEAAPPPGQVVAPDVSAPAPPPPQRPRSPDEDIVVPGQVETQVPPPQGDPRTNSQRLQDIRAWDECVLSMQSSLESDPLRPPADSPEEYCARTLGMADRLAVPRSRLER
jgi:hypothetical protein